MISQPVPSGAVLIDHERSGSRLAYLTGLEAETWQSCAQACSQNEACNAWSWRAGWTGRPQRCELLQAAATPVAMPGSITGLSLSLASKIEASSERAPDETEQAGLKAAEKG